MTNTTNAARKLTLGRPALDRRHAANDNGVPAGLDPLRTSDPTLYAILAKRHQIQKPRRERVKLPALVFCRPL